MIEVNDISVHEWLESLEARGHYSFAKKNIRKQIPRYTEAAVKNALSRLSKKGRIVSLYKGYYLIIPPQYRTKGVLPPQLFLDAFMKHLRRPYYVALLSAAAYHGASHQQPQEFFVMTGFPVLRPTQKKRLTINYISISEIPESLILQIKTDAGYLNISNPALTACDLVQYEKRSGGLNRVATVLCELCETINPADFTAELLHHVHLTTLQRLGYLLEHVCCNHELAENLFDAVQREAFVFLRTPLKSSKPEKGFSSDNRWNVIVNTEIETD